MRRPRTWAAASRSPPGTLTGDDDLKNEGKVDQASASVKEKVGDAADKLKGAFGRDKS